MHIVYEIATYVNNSNKFKMIRHVVRTGAPQNIKSKLDLWNNSNRYWVWLFECDISSHMWNSYNEPLLGSEYESI